MSLTPEQEQRQEEVETAIVELLNRLAGKQLAPDPELIGKVRDVIQDEFGARGIMDEHDFYPWIT